MSAVEYGDFSGRFASCGQLRVHYGDRGDGEPVVLLHGTGPGSSGWLNFRRNVGPLSDHYRVILVDLPRFGRSDKIAISAPRLSYLSTVMREFLSALEIDSAHVVGNSMGGQVAMKLAIDHPTAVRSLVLVGPAITGSSVFAPMPTQVVQMIGSYYKGTGPTREKMRALMEALVFDSGSITDEAVEERYLASVDPEVINANLGPHWERQSLLDDLGAVKARTLIVWGQDDRASPLDHALVLLRRLADARLHVFARCGHSAQSEHADEFNALVIAFLGAGRRTRST